MRNVLVLPVLAILLLSGCGYDDRPAHIEPQWPASEVAVLKGGYYCKVDEIDGDRVDSKSQFNGGNAVTVTPGVHKLVVCVNVAGGPLPPPHRSGVSITFGPRNNVNYFKFICVKGHTYEFSRRSMWNTELMVTDVDTGQKMDIDSMGPD